MTYNLFLDDERHPGRNFPDGRVIVCRTVEDAILAVVAHGVPALCSFDHDLGPNKKSGHDFAHWLINHHLDGHINIKNMRYEVHSQNPVGRANIMGLLDNFYRTVLAKPVQ